MFKTIVDWATEPRFGWAVTAGVSAAASGIWDNDWLLFVTAASASVSAVYAAIDKVRAQSSS